MWAVIGNVNWSLKVFYEGRCGPIIVSKNAIRMHYKKTHEQARLPYFNSANPHSSVSIIERVLHNA